MSKVRNRDSKSEIYFRKALWRAGFRYRKNPTKKFGKPDLVLKKHRAVIFIDSCFWHGCKLHCRLPKTRKEYWTEKISRNAKRDKEVAQYYRRIGWKIFRIWEHDIQKNTKKAVEMIEKTLKN